MAATTTSNSEHVIPSASALFSAHTISDSKIYWDRSHYGSPEAQQIALERSSTLYIGNLTFDTTTSQLYTLFNTVGRVKRIIMGIDRNLRAPCGFAFVEYVTRKSAERAITDLTGTKLDGRPIRVELDAGFMPGREFGRGAKGGQVRDDRRNNASSDPARSRRQRAVFTPANKGVRAYPNFEPASNAVVGEKRGRDSDIEDELPESKTSKME